MISSESDLIFVADVGGTYLRAATVDRDGNLHHRVKHPTPPSEKPDDIVQALVDAAHECESRGVAEGRTIAAVSVAVPGTVDFQEGLVITAPNVPCLNGFHLGAALAAKGDKAGARREFETALRLNEKNSFPEADEARKALAAL